MYLLMKVQRRVTSRSPGQAGWAMHAALMSGNLRLGVIWADGCSESSQTSLRQSNGVGESWWPALIPAPPGPPSIELVPMYCPALAWQNARPWWANPDRLWFFDELANASAPGRFPDTTGIIETPGPVIEELASEVEELASDDESEPTFSESVPYDVSTDASSVSSSTRSVTVVNRWRRSSRDASSQTSQSSSFVLL
jgi:hypothetical protein